MIRLMILFRPMFTSLSGTSFTDAGVTFVSPLDAAAATSGHDLSEPPSVLDDHVRRIHHYSGQYYNPFSFSVVVFINKYLIYHSL